MAKSQKKSKTTHNASPKSSSNGTSRLFKDGLSLVSSLLETRKDWGSERISEFASATQEYATSMKDIPAAKDFISSVADSIQNFSDYISNTRVERMVADASSFAKRYPIAAIAAGVSAVGVIAIVAAQQTKFAGSRKSRRSNRSKGSVRSTRRPPKGAKTSGASVNLH